MGGGPLHAWLGRMPLVPASPGVSPPPSIAQQLVGSLDLEQGGVRRRAVAGWWPTSGWTRLFLVAPRPPRLFLPPPPCLQLVLRARSPVSCALGAPTSLHRAPPLTASAILEARPRWAHPDSEGEGLPPTPRDSVKLVARQVGSRPEEFYKHPK